LWIGKGHGIVRFVAGKRAADDGRPQ